MICVLRRTLVPAMRLWFARRRRLAASYGTLWRRKLPRPGKEDMRKWFQTLETWPPTHLNQLCHALKPRYFRPGEVIFYEGEPVVSLFIVAHGKVTVKRTTGLKNRRERHEIHLGDRGPGYIHGDDIFLEARTRHYMTVKAVEPTLGWFMTRARYFKQLSTLAVSIQSATTVETTLTASGESKSTLRLQPVQVRENRIFSFWELDDIKSMLEQGTELFVPRGSTVYTAGDRGRTMFFVVKGTLERAEVTAAPPSQAQKMMNFNSSTASPDSTIIVGSPTLGRTGSLLHNASFRKSIAKEKEPHIVRSFLNPGQCFGEESVIFGAARSATVMTATDCTLLEVPMTAVTDGMLKDVSAFLQLMTQLNRLRASKLVKPVVADVQPFFSSHAAALFFVRSMTAAVESRGSQLPVKSCVIYLASGRVSIDGVEHVAPALILHDNAFKTTMEKLEVALDNGFIGLEVEKKLVSKSKEKGKLSSAPHHDPTPHFVLPGREGIPAAQLREELDEFSEGLVRGITIAVKALTCVDFWTVRIIDFLRKFPTINDATDIIRLNPSLSPKSSNLDASLTNSRASPKHGGSALPSIAPSRHQTAVNLQRPK